jgi:cell wall-associated NlpC family hydrolase
MKRKIFLGTFLAFMLFQETGFAVPYDQYTTKEDDTFWTIAQKLDVNANELKEINPYVDVRNVWKGLMINVPKEHKEVAGIIPASKVSRTTYTVRSKDTLETVARKFGVSRSYLMSANPQLKDTTSIHSGLVLNIPTAPSSISPSANWEAKADYILALARDQLDVPYIWGDKTPWVGLDCSSLSQYVFSKIGVNLPRTANWQFQYGTPVAENELRKGDLVFFKEHGSTTITHVGIYAGNDIMINADTGPKDGVQLAYVFGDAYYNACYAGARRFIQ